MNKKTSVSLTLAAILIGLVASVSYLIFINKSQLSRSLGQIDQINSANSNLELKLEQKPDYVIRPFNYQSGFDTQIYDQANRKIFLSSTVRLCGAALDEFVFPNNGNILYLTVYNPGTDRPLTEIYSLDTAMLACKRLAISDELRDFGAKILSPDSTRLAVALESQPTELKVIDLAKDSIKTVVSLRSVQTLNGGFGGLSNHFEIRWVDDQTIAYTVYEETITADPITKLKPVIEEKTVRVK